MYMMSGGACVAAVRDAERFIAVVVVLITLSSAHQSNCMESDVPCTADHKEGEACSPGSLSKEFPALYSESWVIDGPENINVTTICRTDDDGVEKAGIVIEWTPPRHNGAESIRGFEVALDGVPGYVQCSIITLQKHIGQRDVTHVFRETFYPVPLERPLGVTVHSLPKDCNHFNTGTKIDETPTCGGKYSTAASWSPDHFEVEYKGRQLHIQFPLPPASLGLSSFFKVLLFNDNDISFQKANNSVFNRDSGIIRHTFNDVMPGTYHIEVTPQDPFWNDIKHCVCRLMVEQSCHSCITSKTKSIDIPGRFGGTAYRISMTPDSTVVEQPTSQQQHELPITWLVASLCAVLAVSIAVFVLMFLRRRRRRQKDETYRHELTRLSSYEDDQIEERCVLLESSGDIETVAITKNLAQVLQLVFKDVQNTKITTKVFDEKSHLTSNVPLCCYITAPPASSDDGTIHTSTIPNETQNSKTSSSTVADDRILVVYDVKTTGQFHYNFILYDQHRFFLPSQLFDLIAILSDVLQSESGTSKSIGVSKALFLQSLQCDTTLVPLIDALKSALTTVSDQAYRLMTSKEDQWLALPEVNREKSLTNSSSSPDSGFTNDKSSDEEEVYKDHISEEACHGTNDWNVSHLENLCSGFKPYLCPDDVSFVAPTECPESLEDFPVNGCQSSFVQREDTLTSGINGRTTRQGSEDIIYQQICAINRRYDFVVSNGQKSTTDISSIFYADA